jgi:hypothetical protein
MGNSSSNLSTTVEWVGDRFVLLTALAALDLGHVQELEEGAGAHLLRLPHRHGRHHR